MNEIIEIKGPDKDKKEIQKKFKELYKKASPDAPDPNAVEELKLFIQENPEIFWETYSLSNVVIDNLLTHPETDPILKMTIKETLTEIRNQLNYTNSTIIEKMVIDSILVSWVRTQYLELGYTNTFVNKASNDQTRKQFDQLLTAAQKRTLRGMEALARLRKTGGNLIINIANKVGTQNVQQNIKLP
ncbi:MAG TPA: hypothetical protein DCY12_02060 [Candidatus Atribacteria bacterium]|nr:hypothetical protein [Candidatus Atribacteria bacterium]